MIAAFHFLRPWWLVALVPVALLAWRLAVTHDAARDWRGIVEPHLLPHLLTRGQERSDLGPVAWMAVGWTLCVIALAGPTWRQAPSAFAEDTAALAIVVEVTPSMRTWDVPPDRLVRSVQKINDLLALRAGAKSALIAYGGSAHLVMPLTRDAEILGTFAGALDPEIMPAGGDAAAEALALAERVVTDAGQPGSILWITDGIAPDQLTALVEFSQNRCVPLRVLAPLPPGAEANALKQAVRDVTLVRPDDGDVRALARQTKVVAAAPGEHGQRWKDGGWWLTPIIALLALAWARPGWLATEEGYRGPA